MSAPKEIFDQILSNLVKNGFPGKKVSFPTSQMATFAHKHELSLGKLLTMLKDERNILSEIEGERVYFSAMDDSTQHVVDDLAGSIDFSQLDAEKLRNMDKGQLQKEIFNIVSNMSPAQLDEIKSKVANMSPEERQKLLNMGKIFGM